MTLTNSVTKRLVTVIALALALSGFLPQALAQDAPALVVDDSTTANDALVQITVEDPGGFLAADQTLSAPEGATISVLAGDLERPRFMAFDDAGNLLVADMSAGDIYRYPYSNGTVGERETILTGLNRPSNVALFAAESSTYLYVGEEHQISRYLYSIDGPAGDQEIVIPNLPQGGHNTRTVAFGPDGMLYLAVGSSCNICDESDEIRATISRAEPDGSNLEIIAAGLRNPVGLAFQPGTDLLWATVNERDNQGNEIPPDLVTIVSEGANYGWPDCFPAVEGLNEADTCESVEPPTVAIQAHAAPLGLAFLDGTDVPESYSGDLVVALHGSWNRQPPAAPRLLLVEFEDGVPVGATDLVTGWQDESGNRSGRPAGVVVAPDGSMIVSDDASGLLFRVTLPNGGN